MVGLFSLPQHEFISNCRRGFCAATACRECTCGSCSGTSPNSPLNEDRKRPLVGAPSPTCQRVNPGGVDGDRPRPLFVVRELTRNAAARQALGDGRPIETAMLHVVLKQLDLAGQSSIVLWLRVFDLVTEVFLKLRGPTTLLKPAHCRLCRQRSNSRARDP